MHIGFSIEDAAIIGGYHPPATKPPATKPPEPAPDRISCPTEPAARNRITCLQQNHLPAKGGGTSCLRLNQLPETETESRARDQITCPRPNHRTSCPTEPAARQNHLPPTESPNQLPDRISCLGLDQLLNQLPVTEAHACDRISCPWPNHPPVTKSPTYD